MEIDKSPIYVAHPASSVNYKHPLMLGISSMAIGFCIGSGRWNWLGRGVTKIASAASNLVANAAVDAFQNRNPNLFSEFYSSKH